MRKEGKTMKQNLDQAHELVFQLDALARFLELDSGDGDEKGTFESIVNGDHLGNPISNMARVQQRLLSDLSKCLDNLEAA